MINGGKTNWFCLSICTPIPVRNKKVFQSCGGNYLIQKLLGALLKKRTGRELHFFL